MSENDKIRFSGITKKSIKEFNQIEAQGWIINRSVVIENLIDDIILSYFNPSERQLFLSHILNSSVMHFGGKLKVLNAIGLDKSTFQHLQRIGNIRNTFAHINITYEMHLQIGRREKLKTKVTDQLNVMNGAGEIKSKDPYELVIEFLGHYQQIEPVLFELRNKFIDQ